MYKNFFKLDNNPFNLTPNTQCFFFEGQRKAILDALIYAISKGDGIIKVVGEVGSGKTILSRMLANDLPDKYELIFLINPRIPADRVLHAIAIELELECEGFEKEKILHEVQKNLLTLYTHNKHTVLVIDEAQAMPLETLEEIRMLSNLETGQDKLLQIVLFGQPELDINLNRHHVRQIKERIIHSFYLPQLTAGEVGRYLYFRMQNAGLRGNFPFTSLACSTITSLTGGHLRKINILAEKCLLAAFTQQTHKIGVLTVLNAAIERKINWRLPILTCLLILLILAKGYQNDSLFFPEKIFSKKNIMVTPSLEKHPLQTMLNLTEKKQIKTSEISTKEPSQFFTIKLLSLTSNPIHLNKKQIFSKLSLHLKSIVYYRETPNSTYKYEVLLGKFIDLNTTQFIFQQLPKNLKKYKPYILKLNNSNKKKMFSLLKIQPIS